MPSIAIVSRNCSADHVDLPFAALLWRLGHTGRAPPTPFDGPPAGVLRLTYTEVMGAHQASANFEPLIWARLIQAPREPISPDAARYLLSIDFSEADHARMQELMDQSNEGELTSDEEAELDGYVNIANVLSVMHSRARVALRSVGFECSRDARNL